MTYCSKVQKCYTIPLDALGSKAVHAGMGMKYKSAGGQLATVSYRFQQIVKV